MKKVSVFFADGCEEIEALTVVDVLRRAGIETEMISVTGKELITGSHNICFHADALFEDVDFSDSDMLVLPGGMPGTLHLQGHDGLGNLLCEFAKEGKQVAAICAAPSVLGGLGILNGKKACCYPSFEEKLTGAEVLMEPVVQDENVTTGRGMGAAIPFALKLVEVLCGTALAEEIRESIIYLQ